VTFEESLGLQVIQFDRSEKGDAFESSVKLAIMSLLESFH
jgi:hypothetical protein